MIALKGGGRWQGDIWRWFQWICLDCMIEFWTYDKVQQCSLCAYEKKPKRRPKGASSESRLEKGPRDQ